MIRWSHVANWGIALTWGAILLVFHGPDVATFTVVVLSLAWGYLVDVMQHRSERKRR